MAQRASWGGQAEFLLPFYLHTCVIFSGALYTLGSVLSQDALMENDFFSPLSFLGSLCFDFYKKTSLWASLKYHSTLLLEFKSVYRPRGPVCVSALTSRPPHRATSGRRRCGIETSLVFELLSSYISFFLSGFQIFNLLNSLQTLILMPREEEIGLGTGRSPVSPMRTLRQQGCLLYGKLSLLEF